MSKKLSERVSIRNPVGKSSGNSLGTSPGENLFGISLQETLLGSLHSPSPRFSLMKAPTKLGCHDKLPRAPCVAVASSAGRLPPSAHAAAEGRRKSPTKKRVPVSSSSQSASHASKQRANDFRFSNITTTRTSPPSILRGPGRGDPLYFPILVLLLLFYHRLQRNFLRK